MTKDPFTQSIQYFCSEIADMNDSYVCKIMGKLLINPKRDVDFKDTHFHRSIKMTIQWWQQYCCCVFSIYIAII